MIGYLQVDGIKGEAQDPEHGGWMNLLSVQQAIHRPMDAGLSGSSRHRTVAFFEDISITKEVDASTPQLGEAIADGTSFETVKIHLVTSSSGDKRIPYLMWELKNARVSSYNLSAVEQTPRPVEQISFNFEFIKQTYIKLDKDNRSSGKFEYTWSVEEGIS